MTRSSEKIKWNDQQACKQMKADSHIVSLVIPSTGRQSLALTKAAVKSQTRPPDELIVVFDANRHGPGWARNEGVKTAKGDLIAFTDDDCVPESGWLEQMIDAVDQYDAAMVSSHYNETDLFLDEVRKRRKFPEATRINPDGFIGNTGNVIYRRACLDQCMELDGFVFNPVFGTYGCEDIDLVSRLKQRGYRLVFIDNRVRHLKRMTKMQYLNHQFHRGIGIGIMYEAHKNTQQDDRPPDKSLLWNGSTDRFPIVKWALMVWKKVLGPFDRQSFSSWTSFFVFWTGEKLQAMGFLYSVIHKYRNRPMTERSRN